MRVSFSKLRCLSVTMKERHIWLTDVFYTLFTGPGDKTDSHAVMRFYLLKNFTLLKNLLKARGNMPNHSS